MSRTGLLAATGSARGASASYSGNAEQPPSTNPLAKARHRTTAINRDRITTRSLRRWVSWSDIDGYSDAFLQYRPIVSGFSKEASFFTKKSAHCRGASSGWPESTFDGLSPQVDRPMSLMFLNSRGAQDS